MYVLRTFEMTSPSLTMPTPILLALPSNPIEITIFRAMLHRNIYNQPNCQPHSDVTICLRSKQANAAISSVFERLHSYVSAMRKLSYCYCAEKLVWLEQTIRVTSKSNKFKKKTIPKVAMATKAAAKIPKITYVGRTTNFSGKTLWEIVGNLKNFGVGRIVVRQLFQRYEEPTFFKIVKVEALPNEVRIIPLNFRK